MAQFDLDDAAYAALFPIRHATMEHIGLVYRDGSGFASTAPHRSGSTERSAGTFAIPNGSIRALYHSHPEGRSSRRSMTPSVPRDRFSDDDIAQARTLGVPSYISAGDKVMRFDPSTGKTEEVLAQFPLEEIRKKYLVRGLLK